MKKNSKKDKIQTLRSKHAAIAVILICFALVIAMGGAWSSYFCMFAAAITSICSYKYEKEDELVKQNMARANNIVMWTLIVLLVVFAGYARWGGLSYTVYLSASCFALALRSILFIWFDKTPKVSAEDE